MININQLNLMIPEGFQCIPTPSSWRGVASGSIEVEANDEPEARDKIVKELTFELTIYISSLPQKSLCFPIFLGFLAPPSIIGNSKRWSSRRDSLVLLFKKI